MQLLPPASHERVRPLRQQCHTTFVENVYISCATNHNIVRHDIRKRNSRAPQRRRNDIERTLHTHPELDFDAHTLLVLMMEFYGYKFIVDTYV